MSSSETLLKATLNRLFVRVSKGLSDFRLTFKEAPNRFKEEFTLFREEVIDEATRLEDESNGLDESDDFVSSSNPSGCDETQQIVDRLRAKVAQLSRKIEGSNR